MPRDRHAGGAGRQRDLAHRLNLRGCVIGEDVDRDHRIDAKLLEILQMPHHIDSAGFDIGHILFFEPRVNQLARDDAILAGMRFERADGGDQHDGVGLQAG